jgi:hypothetical protein
VVVLSACAVPERGVGRWASRSGSGRLPGWC